MSVCLERFLIRQNPRLRFFFAEIVIHVWILLTSSRISRFARFHRSPSLESSDYPNRRCCSYLIWRIVRRLNFQGLKVRIVSRVTRCICEGESERKFLEGRFILSTSTSFRVSFSSGLTSREFRLSRSSLLLLAGLTDGWTIGFSGFTSSDRFACNAVHLQRWVGTKVPGMMFGFDWT